LPDLNDPEYLAWLDGYRRKPSLKIRVEPFADREAHAATLVANQMKMQRQYGLPLIPSAETAHFRGYCVGCDEEVVWTPKGKEPKCPDCRLAELAQMGKARAAASN
jgi:hypothetical protein